MIKCIGLIKRRPGLTHAQFADYYENHHAPLARPYLAAARRYARRYLETGKLDHQGDAALPGAEEYDCLTELWFDDRPTMEATLAHLATPEVAAVIVPDEERFIDRTALRFFIIENESINGE